MSITVRSDLPKLVGALNEIKAGMGDKVVAVGVGRAAKSAYTTAKRELSRVGGWRQGYIAENSGLTRLGALMARIYGRKRETNLVEFGARQTRKGVSAAPWRTRRIFPGTFLVTGKNGNRIVVSRAGKSRLPLDSKYGPSLNRELRKDEVVNPTLARFNERAGLEVSRLAAYRASTIFSKYGL
ncbi:phage tail protein [Prosthecomicrobium hirschii]|uniref:phage tail protein n=1 Tax=Prosthecodimorpha hirschii TaxID=665126 RepID=UPI0022203874|nr:phage tail protein [Prosthecomicrobium hirschii]MCW1838739.1 phage tail protein [Prosthecomicrobium hirschii]